MSYRVTLPDGQDPIAISHAEANLEDALLWLKRDLEKYGGSSDRNVASGCYLFRLETQGKPPCRKAMSKGHVERPCRKAMSKGCRKGSPGSKQVARRKSASTSMPSKGWMKRGGSGRPWPGQIAEPWTSSTARTPCQARLCEYRTLWAAGRVRTTESVRTGPVYGRIMRGITGQGISFW